MRSIRRYVENIAEDTAYILMATPLILAIGLHGLSLHKAYESGFAGNYNYAIIRNADIDKNGSVTSTEELRIRQILHDEITMLRQEGSDLGRAPQEP